MSRYSYIIILSVVIIFSSCFRKTALELAKVEFEQGDHAKVLELIASDTSFDAKLLKANSYLQTKNYESTVQLLKSLNQKQDTVNVLLIEGLYKLRLYNDCLKAINILNEKRQNNFFVLDKLTRIYHNMDDYNKLLLISNQGLKLFPDSSIFRLGK